MLRSMLFVAALALLPTCIPPQTVAVEAQCPVPRSSRTVWRGDMKFSPQQRNEIMLGFGDVWLLSRTRIAAYTTWDVDWMGTPSVVDAANGPMLIRAESWMSSVTTQDDAVSARYGRPTRVLAWTDRSRMEIFFVVDRIGSDLRQVAAHELMHAAGVEWPNCAPPRDCDHVIDTASIMSAGLRHGVTSFTEHDLAFCRAACLCP